MSRVARATTIAVLGALTLGGVGGVYQLVRPTKHGGSFHTYVYFRDANGLPVGSRVKIAGIVVGEIDALAIENGQARVSLRLRDDIALWDDAWAEKKAASPLADSYVELSPGGPDVPAGSPAPAVGEHRRLRSGEPIARVLETATTDRVLRGLEHGIPRAIDRVVTADQLTDEARQWATGPLSARLVQLDRQLGQGALAAPLEDAAARLERFDRSLARAQARVHAAVPTVDDRLTSLVDDTAAARDRLAGARTEVVDSLRTVRTDLDRADDYAARAQAALAGLTADEPDRQGTLARLIDDPALADELEESTASLAETARDLDRLKALMGVRAELNLIGGSSRFVVSAEIGTKRDTFYAIEIVKGPWGGVPETSLVEDPGGGYVRRTTIRDSSRFTAQWGRRFGPLALRAGLKESMFGVGVDAALGNGRLRLSLDAMESNFSRIPRLKLVAALQVMRAMYVVGGIDDAFNPGRDLPIGDGPTEPSTLSKLHYGRDFVLGIDLRFSDPDVSALLRLYGALIATLLS